MAQVPATSTPMSQGQALGIFLAAGCPQTALLMVAAQSAVETAGFTGGLIQYNFGNVTPSAAQLAAGASYWMTTKTKGMKYLAFTDPIAGAQAMLGWLQSRGLYTYAQNNDLSGYMAQLAKGCYLGCIGRTDATGHVVSQQDYDNYQAGISTWMQKLSGVTPVPPTSPAPSGAPSSTPSVGPLLVGLLALGALGAAGAYVASHGGLAVLAPAYENPAPRARESHVQSLMFSRGEPWRWTPARAQSWAHLHGYRTKTPDVTDRFVHLRVSSPTRFERIRTVSFGRGVQARIGFS